MCHHRFAVVASVKYGYDYDYLFLWKWKIYLEERLANGNLVGDTQIHKDYMFVWDTICECLQAYIAICAKYYPVCILT